GLAIGCIAARNRPHVGCWEFYLVARSVIVTLVHDPSMEGRCRLIPGDGRSWVLALLPDG
ncbi:hypothetical protein ACLOJK_040395, partial [Asimina triloba]